MGVTVLFYKLFQFKDDLAAILKRYCFHGNVTYKFILTTIRLLTCSLIQINLLQRIIIDQKYDLNFVFFIWLENVGSHLQYVSTSPIYWILLYGVRCIPNIAVIQPVLYPQCYRLQSTMTGNTSKCSTCLCSITNCTHANLNWYGFHRSYNKVHFDSNIYLPLIAQVWFFKWWPCDTIFLL